MNAVTFDPQGPFKRDPLPPDQMRDRLTRTQDVFVQCHLGVPRIERDRWSLTIDGMVECPRTLRFDDLARYPMTEVTSAHQCCGSPLAPFEQMRRVCNVRWGGVQLADVLADCRPSPAAQYIWSYGADFGEFSGVVVDAYVKDLPVARSEADVLIAYEMNGSALPAEHGFPVRLVVPGFYGTNSVKWLSRMSFAKTRATGAFTTRWYNDPVLNAAGEDSGETVPVWSIAPESIIVSPAPGHALRRDTPQEVWGWAWADRGVERVEVSADGGATWMEGQVEPRVERAWQRFFFHWRATAPGAAVLCSRVHSYDGATQPEFGRRNAIHRIEVKVT
jgi:DMSO/TMAO reductase YedYZ molybdopterin-dependent catalytic subunit